jgi:two-component sensor histidine kinase/integral membrane sensor domain MASE1
MFRADGIDSKSENPLTADLHWLYFLLFGGAFSAICILGASTRGHEQLALIWPANAFMLGMLVRFPALARPLGWFACFVGLAVAVAIIGRAFATGVALIAYNLGVVATGYLLLSRYDRADQLLSRQISVLYLLFAAVAASTFAGIVGLTLIGPVFGEPITFSAFPYWFSVELLNQLAFLPMVLSFPQSIQGKWQWPHFTFHDQARLALLIVSAAVGISFGGVAALAFPVPALLWCAISYRVFPTALLTCAFCIWAILATKWGYAGASEYDRSLVVSICMGAALVSLAPLIVSTTTTIRNQALDQMKHLATEREVVSHELEHRIENLFTLVNGLISLSARDNPEMLPLADPLRNRLLALHRAHGLIRSGNTPPGSLHGLTSMQDLIGILLKPYETDRLFVVTGDDALMDRGLVTSIALVIHELATNSTKYGALSVPDGALQIHIRCTADEVYLDWAEKGLKPGVKPFADSGFGSKLLDLTIKSQLRGSYSRNLTSLGLRIELVLPRHLFNSGPLDER